MIQQLCNRLVSIGMLTTLIASSGLLLHAAADARPLGRPKAIYNTGSVRGGCPAIDTSLQNRKLTALIDAASDPALTTQAYPTFWFYLPITRTEDVTTAEFELMDENQKSVLSTRKIKVALPEKAGIVRFTLPANEKPLQAGKEYFWVFRVVCDTKDRSGNPMVAGWIKRVEPQTALVNQLKSTPKPDQFKAYAANKIWFEQINLLAQYRTKHTQDWTKLLNTFGLQTIAQQPIVDLKQESSSN